MVIGKSSLLSRLSTTQWMVKPEFLYTMQNILELKLADNLPNIKMLSEEEDDSEESFSYQVGSKLVMNINGVLMSKASGLDAMCGMVGMNMIHDTLDSMHGVDHLILNWDCPGGDAQGTPQLANRVHGLRDSMRITSLISGQMCSAAYYIGSAGDEIYSDSLINDVGCIGVVALHCDQSRRDEANGLKFTYLSAGEFKTTGNRHEPLTDNSKAELLRGINYSHEVFKADLKKFRPQLNIEEVANGRVWKTGQAVDNKLIDGFASLNDILEW